ncbi:hypothetical protein AGTUEHA105_LOCUS5274 [Agrobacterium tumefaciens]|nr:hypothetical protein AGTUEHA105_LOCUS5274 [Agrobacterium tumefaciens]
MCRAIRRYRQCWRKDQGALVGYVRRFGSPSRNIICPLRFALFHRNSPRSTEGPPRRELLLAHQIQRLPRSGYRRFQRLRRSKLREFVSVHMLLALTVGRARRFAHPIPLGRSLEHSSIFAAKLLDTFVANPCSGAVGIQVFCHHQISLRRRLEGSSGIEHDWFQLGGESCDGTWMADLMMGILAFRRGRP